MDPQQVLPSFSPVHPFAFRGARLGSWEGEPAVEFGCRFGDLAGFLPRFAREPFGVGLDEHTANQYREMVVRLPDAHRRTAVPVAVVSTRYALVQHTSVAAALGDALAARGIEPGRLPTAVALTEYGSRLHLSVQLPEHLGIEVDGQERLSLTVECLNSVDQSIPLTVLLGWFRRVCSNGLFVRDHRVFLRRWHRVGIHVGEIDATLAAHMGMLDAERRQLAAWAGVKVPDALLAWWVDEVVAKRWGRLAAARAWLIGTTGHDGHIPRPNPHLAPHAQEMTRRIAVPGSPAPADTLYKVLQVLAWVAGTTREHTARITRRAEIPAVMAPLARITSRAEPIAELEARLGRQSTEGRLAPHSSAAATDLTTRSPRRPSRGSMPGRR